MNITSMSSRELYRALAGCDISCGSLQSAPQMKGKIKAVYSSNRDTFSRDKDLFDGSSVTSLFETGSPIRIMTSCGMKAEELAEHFGGIGKRLDAAYSEGKFTKEEYDELNAGLDEYIEKMTSRSERMTAVWATGKGKMEEGLKSDLAAGITITKGDIRPIEEIQAEISDRVDEYVENVCKIDRITLLDMINSIRYSLILK